MRQVAAICFRLRGTRFASQSRFPWCDRFVALRKAKHRGLLCWCRFLRRATERETAVQKREKMARWLAETMLGFAWDDLPNKEETADAQAGLLVAADEALRIANEGEGA